MKLAHLVFPTTLVVLSACVQDRIVLNEDELREIPETEDYHEELFALETQFCVETEMCATRQDKRLSGEWRSQGGVRSCDGYLTRHSDQDYCEAEVPGDWRPFEFEGKTHYTQPLSVSQ